ncbi:P1 family peptidase [Alsobacter sp. KACC 23698]|uniref:P1 family peptidase n=1 Tax=Alsobacter sp. KACC 23698 TaxID=3149229 RepID=A0AAU7JF55_9HYPH
MTRKARARDLGSPFPDRPGPWNAITDVPGLEVGFTTLVEGDGAKAVRTGVTAILPRGGASAAGAVWAGADSFNGNGEMTGLHWVAEAGARSQNAKLPGAGERRGVLGVLVAGTRNHRKLSIFCAV